MNKNELIDLLKKLKNNLEHYKNKPNFIDLLQKLTKKDEIIEKLIDEYINSLTDQDYSNQIKTLTKYLGKFEKKYIARIETSDGVVYEYTNEYKYFPNKKSSHIHNYFKDKFKIESFDEIIIDRVKRPDTLFTSDLLDDIKHSESCVIIVKKK
jgi:hypothetical protein